jgi:hypothetical protein
MNKKIAASTIRGLFDNAPVTVTVVEEEDPAKEKPAKKSTRSREKEEEVEEVEPEPELLAEVHITYREGLPDVEGPLMATLYVESNGLRFEFEDEDEDEYSISFEKVEAVLEPARGDFPQGMKRKALAAKVGGKVGKLAAGMLGQMIGGTTGDIVEKAGGGASGMAEREGNLGKPPRNRITVIALLRKERCKVRFDAYGDSREDMNAEAKALYRHIKKAHHQFSTPAVDEGPIPLDYEEVPEEEEPVEERAPVSEPQEKNGRTAALPAPLVPVMTSTHQTGKPFRVMHSGRIHGPYSLEELRALLGSGKITANDMIGVETWMPFSTLSGMIGSGTGRSVASASTTKAGGASTPAPHTPPSSEDGAIPVDDEFKL